MAAGDIPDTVAYVRYRNAQGRYSFVHPEGWTSVEAGQSVRFADKLNGIEASVTAATTAPTVQSAQVDIARLRSSQRAVRLISVAAVGLPAGTGVRITYQRDSAPDPVTGKIVKDEVQRYLIFAAGRLVTLDLYGAVGSDNADPYAKISQSLQLG